MKLRLEKFMSQMDNICSLYTDVLACRSLANNYALFFLERYLQLKIKAIRAGKMIELKTIEDFINCCKQHGVKFKRLLCEFYLYNFVLEEEVENNLNQFLGDVQFQAFISFVVNQLKWFKAHNTFQRQEYVLNLWITGEPKHPLQILANHKNLMTREGVIKILGPIQKEIVQKRIKYFLSIQESSLDATKLRWTVSTSNIQNREPFNYKNFKLVADHFLTYSNLILREGPYWLGCRFCIPIIWYHVEGYRAIYELPEGQTGPIFELLAKNHGFRPLYNIPSPTYSLTNLHTNYLLFMRTWNGVSRGVYWVTERVCIYY